jgi:hypothetical protein
MGVFIGAQGWFIGRMGCPVGQVDGRPTSHMAGWPSLPCNRHFPRRVFLLGALEAFPKRLSGNCLNVGSPGPRLPCHEHSLATTARAPHRSSPNSDMLHAD